MTEAAPADTIDAMLCASVLVVPEVEDVPVVDEVPPVVEVPVVDEAPPVDDVPLIEDVPAADDVPLAEDVPVAEEFDPELEPVVPLVLSDMRPFPLPDELDAAG